MLELNATVLAEETSFSPLKVSATLFEGPVVLFNVDSQILADYRLIIREVISGSGSGIWGGSCTLMVISSII